MLIGHDWGALATYVAAAAAPDRWRRVVAAAVPPQAAIAEAFFTYDQLQRSWYMFFFQSPLADMAVPVDDLAFIDRLWADWSPGYEATEDLGHVKDCLRDPANLTAALGYYRATIGSGARSPELDAIEATAAAGPPPQPTLYLHGVDDGCMGIELADRAASILGSDGSRVERVDGTGHFLHLEAPDRVNGLILDFLDPDPPDCSAVRSGAARCRRRRQPRGRRRRAWRRPDGARAGSSGQPMTAGTAVGLDRAAAERVDEAAATLAVRALEAALPAGHARGADGRIGGVDTAGPRAAAADRAGVAARTPGRQTVAPRSSIAWFQRQPAPGGTEASAAACTSRGRSDRPARRASTRATFVSTTPTSRSNANASTARAV